MPAEFRALGTFTIPSRRYFVIIGDVIEGNVKSGMHVAVAVNSSTRFAIPIHAIEMVSASNGSHIGLVFAPSDDDEFELWKTLNIRNEVLEITENG